MQINIFCPSLPERTERYDGTDVDAHINYIAESDCVLDVDAPFSQPSKMYHPSKRALLLRHPPAMIPQLPAAKDEVSAYYGLGILSIHPCFVGSPNAVLFMAGGTNVTPLEEPGERELGMSGLFSDRYFPELGLHGFNLRRYVLDTQSYFQLPGTITSYRREWKGVRHDYPIERKDDCFGRYMFHLAIESHSQSYFFTSHIIDCFATFTVPIYYGDPMIGQSFDSRGIIVLDESRLHDQINSLTESDYRSRMEAIRVNHELSRPYWNPLARAASVIKARLERSF